MASLGEIVVSQLDAAFIDLAGPAAGRGWCWCCLCSCDWLYLPPADTREPRTGWANTNTTHNTMLDRSKKNKSNLYKNHDVFAHNKLCPGPSLVE